MSTPSPSAGDRADLALIAEAAAAAGALILRYFQADPKVWEKAPGDPVTEADLAADALLRERLQGARPGYGWISEESAPEAPRAGAARSFIVDPIDGTRAFVKGRAEFVVSVGLAEGERMLAGAICEPVSGDLYTALRGGGASRNGAPIEVSAKTDLSGARLLGDPGRLKRLKTLGASAETVNSAALRLAYVAEGRHDGWVAVREKSVWDLAAGQILIEEAGGRLTDHAGAPFRYSSDAPRLSPPLAAGPTLHALLQTALAEPKDAMP